MPRARLLATLLVALVVARPVTFGSQAPRPAAVPATPAAQELVLILTAVLEYSREGITQRSELTREFRLASEWSGGFLGGVAPGRPPSTADLQVLAKGGAAGPGRLYDLRGSLLALAPGETLQFRHTGGTGTGSDSNSSARIVMSYVPGRGERTQVKMPGVSPSETTRSNFVGTVLLKRTLGGAEVVFRSNTIELEDAGSGALGDVDAFADDHLTPAATRFVLTDEDLEHWDRLDKVLEQVFTQDGQTMRYKVRLTTGGPPADEYEVSVAPGGYDTWMPEGNIGTPGAEGNRIRLDVWVHEKGKPDATANPKADKVVVTFSLQDVSMEPGVCSNWPPLRNEKPDYDLKFLPDENAGLEVLGPDQARTKAPVTRTSATVSAFDFGAWGYLKVTAETQDGRTLPVRFRDRLLNEIPLALPQDEDGNHIADGWQRRSTYGKAGAADEEDTPKGNGFKGDGLTLYEEYRGFAVQGEHRRTDPDIKDVFFSDQTGQAQEGLVRFEKVTGLKVRDLKEVELPLDRVVNRNHAQSPHLVDQHGVPIVLWKEGTDAAAVASDLDNQDPGPPRTTLRIVLPRGTRYAPASGSLPGTTGRELGREISTIVHEMGHAVGIGHHGDKEVTPVVWSWVKGSDGQWSLAEEEWSADYSRRVGTAHRIRVIRESTGEELTRPEQLTTARLNYSEKRGGFAFSLAPKGGWFSGDDTCVMRYVEDGNVVYASATAPDVRYIPDLSWNTPAWGFCRSRTGTGVNAASHKPEPRAGDAVRGNCLGQLVVNDRYAPAR